MRRIPIRFISVAAIAALATCVATVSAQTKKGPTKTQGTQATGARAAGHATGMEIWTSDQGDWMDCAGLPLGCKIKVAKGDPSKGPSDAYEKFPAGYGVPLHYHTAAQSFWLGSGTLEFVTWKTGEKKVLKAPSFVYEPPKTIHRGTCVGPEDCYFFSHSAGPLDIHYVDEKGTEIPPKTK